MRGGSGVLALALLAGCSSAPAGILGDGGAAGCGSCHATEYAAWSASGLASSGTSPVFSALSARVARAWGKDAAARCVSCHQPGFGGDPGVGCVACHAATGNLASRDGLLTVDLAEPVSGPFDDAVPTPAHGSRTYGLLESPELCGTCHEVTGPRLFHETTLDELRGAPGALTAGGCIGCHMPETSPGLVAPGSTFARARRDHAFVGFDPPWGATAGVAKRAAERTRQLLAAAVTLSATRAGTGIDVSLTNRAGHSVPTGIAVLRGVWVDVELTGATGEHRTMGSVLELGAQPTAKGRPVALITDADAVASNELRPGATRTVHVEAPPSLPAPVTAVVTLRARAIRADVLDALGLDGVREQVPTHAVAVVRVP